jgi:aspartate 1-decarboxylase
VDVSLLKSKIHRATVTAAELNYEGSLTISADLAELVGLEEYERILVSNLASGERFETYVVYGVRNHGIVQLNGATAHLGKPGDRLIIMSFGLFEAEEVAIHQPKVIVLDEKNRVSEQR